MTEYRMKERTLGNLLSAKGQQNGNRKFVLFEDQEISYGRLDEITSQIASGLYRLGVRKGHTVCIMMSNCPEFIYAWLGLSKLGAIMVPINIFHKGELLAYLLNDCGTKMIILEQNQLEQVMQIAEKLPNITALVVNGGTEEQAGQTIRRFDVFSYEVLYEEPFINDSIASTVYENDPFCILYTSGTSGPSKGVTLPNNYAVSMGELVANSLRYTENDIVYNCLPLFHGNSPMLAFMPALVADGSFVLGRRFTASNYWNIMRHYQVTVFNALGGMVSILHKQPPRAEDLNNSVRICFGMVPKTIFEDFERRFQLKIIEAYGSTECGLVTINTLSNRKKASMGQANQDVEVRIVDDNDHEVPPGTVGELITRPKKPWTMMNGYHNMPDKTVEAFRNLWYHTGDYAYRDEEGFCFFVDRKKDFIRRKGENISSYEVERIISMHPAVLECAVVAVPADTEEDEVKVVVVLKSGEALSYEELISFCDQNMAFYMVPRYAEFREELPKTPSEKVEKYKLKNEGLTPVTWDRIAAGVKLSRERY